MTFGRVLGPPGDLPHGLAEPDGLQRRHVSSPHRHFLHDSLSQRRSPEKASSKRIGLVEQSVMRDDPPDQTHSVGSLGVDALPREQ